MKTLLNDTKLIEEYILGQLSVESKLAFKKRLQVDPALRMHLYFQKKVYKVIKMYHRKKLKEELNGIHNQVFNDPYKFVFQQKIYSLFK